MHIKHSQKQRGFAMLEVVLAVVIIAIASFGIYKLYDSSSTSSKLTDTEGTVSQVVSAATQLSYTLSRLPTATELYNSGILPPSVWKTFSSGTLIGSFGLMTYTGNTTYASIAISGVAGSAVLELCSHIDSMGDVYYATGTDTKGTPYSAGTVPTLDANAIYTVTLYFPASLKPAA